LDKASREKIRNYFSDRIEEIKEGTFIPSYDQIKDLPEFSGIKRDAFRIARKKWYKQNLHASFYEFSSRFDKEYEKKYLKEKRKNGLCYLIPGVIIIVFVTFSLLGVLGTVFLVTGIILIWIIYNIIARNKFSSYLASSPSEEEYVQKLRKRGRLKGILLGYCFLIPGVILTVFGLYGGVMSRWYGTVWGVLVPGIIFLVIGIILIIYYSIKKLQKVKQ